MNALKSMTLSFTGILVEDKDSKGYTAFFKQFPQVIAEGDTEESAFENLVNTLQAVLECDTTNVNGGISDESKVIKKTIEFQAIPD